MTLGPIAFLSPWLLAGLLALPVIWWLLRTIPPRPRRIEFPPTRILVGIENREKTPAQDALVADADPHGGGRARHPGAGRAGAQSQQREGAVGLRAGGAGGRQRLGRRGAVGRAHLHDRAADRRGRGPEPPAADRADRQCRQGAEPQGRGAGRGPLDRRRRAAAAVRARPHGGGAGDRRRARAAPPTPVVVWLADGIDHDGTAREFADKLSALAGGRLSVVETRPGQEALGAVAGVAQRRPARCPGAARRGRAARRHAACHVGARPAPRRGAVHARRRRHARARHLRHAAGAQEPGDARRDRRRALGRAPCTCSMPARSGTASASSRAPRASRRSRCWRRSTTSSARCCRSRRSPRATTPISRPSSTASSSATSRC